MKTSVAPSPPWPLWPLAYWPWPPGLPRPHMQCTCRSLVSMAKVTQALRSMSLRYTSSPGAALPVDNHPDRGRRRPGCGGPGRAAGPCLDDTQDPCQHRLNPPHTSAGCAPTTSACAARLSAASTGRDPR